MKFVFELKKRLDGNNCSRINKIAKLKSIPKKFGVEVDLRSYGSKIVLNHDPFKTGDKLDYLSNYNHGTLIPILRIRFRIRGN